MNTQDDWAPERAEMVSTLRRYGIRNAGLLNAMARIRRHIFIPEPHRNRNSAYGDHPEEIGWGQTISQPFIVAYMIEKLHIEPGEKVLEIGTGSGYEAAVLAEIGAEVYTIEVVPELAAHAARTLAAEGYKDVRILTGNGYAGWPEHAPYDAIIGSCAPAEIPSALVEQLREGGRMILPVGIGFQNLRLVRKREGRIETATDMAVRFVPMIGAPS